MNFYYIDPHVHFRDISVEDSDKDQDYKETIRHGLKIAESQGVKKVIDMPNVNPPITLEKHVKKRLDLVPEDKKDMYYLYMGVTLHNLPIAVRCYNTYDAVVALKMFAGKSVGDLEIINEADQKQVYKTLANLRYEGVLAVHCEKEAYIKDIFKFSEPYTHAESRPKEAEIESVKDQIKFAKETGFEGTLHICHVSCPETVDLVDDARRYMRITCGVTPHHIMWSDEMLKRPDGLIYKMNPPLRSHEDVAGLRDRLREGKIDWIETDHAPHALGEKLFPPYMSGFPSLYMYKKCVEEFLPLISVNEDLIKKLTYGNIRSVFKI